MAILHAAEAALERHDVRIREQELVTCRRRQATLQQQLDTALHRIPWWERLAFFHESVDEARAAALQSELEEAREATERAERQWSEALAQCRVELPPLEVVDRAARVCQAAAADPWLARGGKGGEELAAELDAMAERVRSIWFAGVDRGRIVASLWENAAGHATAAEPAALQPDERLGWRPMAEGPLRARAAHALGSTGFVQARARLVRERADWSAAAERLEQARARITLADRLIPGRGEREQSVTLLERALSAEEQQLVHAREEVSLSISRALASHPVMRVHDAVLACAAVLHAPAPAREGNLSAHGVTIFQPSAGGRAVLWTAITELRNACDAAFPGLVDLLWPRTRAPHPLGLATQPSPYRQAAEAADEERAPPAPDDPRGHAYGQLDDHGMRSQLGRALAHAVALGDIERQHATAQAAISTLDRLAFWSDSEAEGAAHRWQTRRRWHHASLDGLTADMLGRVERVMGDQPLFALRQAIVATDVALRGVRTHEGSSSSPRTCPVLGQAEALGSAQHVRNALSRHFGPAHTREQLAVAIEARLRQPRSAPRAHVAGAALDFPQVVEIISAQLHGTPFAQHREQARQAGWRADQAERAAAQADRAVSLLDRVNVFSDSEAERQRDHQRDASEAQRSSAWSHAQAAEQLLERALGAYPPARLYYAFESVTAAVTAIRAEQRRHTTSTKVGKTTVRSTRYTCRLIGKDRARDAFRRWTQWAIQIFGPLPTAGELLERYAAREL